MTPRRRGGPTRGEAVRPPARTRSANPDRELVAAVRAEVAAIEPTRACCRAAERIGLGSAATGEAHSAAVARLAVRLGPSPAASAPGCVSLVRLGRRGGSLPHGVAAGHVPGARLAQPRLRTHPPRARGGPGGRAQALAGRLASLGLPAAVRLRRGRAVLTWKSGERVAAFLRGIGAGPSLLDRAGGEGSGPDAARRGQPAAERRGRQPRTFGRGVRPPARGDRRLEAEGRLAGEREAVRAVAVARLRGPDATLGELAAELGVTRSSVQRALERIERLALQLPDGDPSRWTDERGTAPPAGGIGQHLRLDAGNAPFGPVREGLVPDNRGMRPIIIAANWKMNTTPSDAGPLASAIATATATDDVVRRSCRPTSAWHRCAMRLPAPGSPWVPRMCTRWLPGRTPARSVPPCWPGSPPWVHRRAIRERRRDQHETDELVGRQARPLPGVRACARSGCVGEQLDEREAGRAEEPSSASRSAGPRGEAA